MSVENPEKLLAPSTICAKQDSNTETAVTTTGPTLDTPSESQSSPCRFPKRPPTAYIALSGWWYMEFLCLVLSFALFGFYCLFLYYLNNKPQHGLGIFNTISLFTNMGSVLSQVSVVLKLLMFVPVSSAIGQLSWYRYWNAGSRPVADLQTFNAASRGLWGSIRLLLSRHIFNSLQTTLGCILTIAALFLGSTMQNAVGINFYDTEALQWGREYEGYFTSAIPFVDLFEPNQTSNVVITDNNNIYVDPKMEATFYSAWLYRMNPQTSDKPPSFNISSFVPVNCTSSYCDWEPYTTLVVRSQCASIPAIIDSAGFGQSTPGNISSDVNNTQSILNFQARTKIPETSSFASAFADQSAVIVHLAAVSVKEPHLPEAVECVLHWEVQHFPKIRYNTSDDSLQSDEALVGHISPTKGRPTTDIVFEAPCNPGIKNGTCDYRVGKTASQNLQEPLVDFFDGYVLQEPTNKTHLRAFGKSKAVEIFTRTWIERAKTDTKPLASCLNEYMSNMAGSITGNILSTASQVTTGKPLYDAGRYCIKWRWVIYSSTMMGLSAYIFLFTVWKTRQMPVWKTSLLPFLYHGLQDESADRSYDLTHLGWMEHVSRNRRVTLRDGNDGLGLRLRDSQRDTGV